MKESYQETFRRLSKDTLVLLGLFFVAHLFAIVFPFLMWDDWVVYAPEIEQVKQSFSDFGHAYSYPVVELVRSLDERTPRCLAPVFLLSVYALSWLILFVTIRKCQHVGNGDAFWILALSISLPLNFVKFVTSAISYSFVFPLFFLGVYVFQGYLKPGGHMYYAASLLLLSIGLMTPSLAFVYYLMVVFLLWENFILRNVESNQFWQKEKALGSLISFSPFFLLPFVVFFLRSYFFTVSEKYITYNKITVSGLIDGVRKLPLWIAYTIEDLPDYAIFSSGAALSLFLLVFLSLLFLRTQDVPPSRRKAFWGVLVGAVFCVAAVYPYIVVGKIPRLADWDHRQQLVLQPFSGIVAYYLLRAAGAGRLGLSAAVALFAAVTSALYLDHHRDGHLQNAVAAAMARNPVVRDARSIAIDDVLADERALSRRLRNYEWSGLARQVFGDASRFVDSMRPGELGTELERFIREPCDGRRIGAAYNNFDDWTPDGRVIVVRPRLLPDAKRIGSLETIRLTALLLRDRPAYEAALRSMVDLDVVAIVHPSDATCP